MGQGQTGIRAGSIEVEGPDGAIYEFPQGTPADEMHMAMAQRFPPSREVSVPTPGADEGPSLSNIWNSIKTSATKPLIPAESWIRSILPKEEMKGPAMSYGPLGPGGLNLSKEDLAGAALAAGRGIETLSTPTTIGAAGAVGALSTVGGPMPYVVGGGLSADMLRRATNEFLQARQTPSAGTLPREKRSSQLSAGLDALFAVLPWLKIPGRGKLPIETGGGTAPGEIPPMPYPETIETTPEVSSPAAPKAPPPEVLPKEPWYAARDRAEAQKAAEYQAGQVRRQPPPWSGPRPAIPQGPEGAPLLKGELPETTGQLPVLPQTPTDQALGALGLQGRLGETHPLPEMPSYEKSTGPLGELGLTGEAAEARPLTEAPISRAQQPPRAKPEARTTKVATGKKGRPETLQGAIARMGVNWLQTGEKFVVNKKGNVQRVKTRSKNLGNEQMAWDELPKWQLAKLTRTKGGIIPDELALRLRENGFHFETNKEAFEALRDPKTRNWTADQFQNPELKSTEREQFESFMADAQKQITELSAKLEEFKKSNETPFDEFLGEQTKPPSGRESGEEGFARIKDDKTRNLFGVIVKPQDTEWLSKPKAANPLKELADRMLEYQESGRQGFIDDLRRQILQAPASKVSKRDMLGLKPKSGKTTEMPLFAPKKKGLFE